jgi:hypothetical protein
MPVSRAAAQLPAPFDRLVGDSSLAWGVGSGRRLRGLEKSFAATCRENIGPNLATILLTDPRTIFANGLAHCRAQGLDQFGIVGARRAQRLGLPGQLIA